MPKCRSAMERTSPRESATRWRTPSITTKSLPWPCILVKRSLMVCRRGVGRGPILLSPVRRGLARRARLEALVRPEILLGHLFHALLDECVHAAHIGLDVARRVILPRGIEARDIALPHLARDDGDHLGAGDLREARQRRDGRR